MDKITINCVENHSKIGLPTDAEAILLMEVDGSPTQVEEDIAIIEKVCKPIIAERLK